MARKTRWACAIAVGVLLAGGGWFVFMLVRQAEKRDLWLSIDVEQIGQVLIVFAEGKGRMPTGFDELLRDGYVEKRADGHLYPTRRIIGHNTGYGAGPRDIPFHDLSHVGVKYGTGGPEGPGIVLSKESSGQAIRIAELFSGLIREKLNERNTPSSRQSRQ